MIRVVAALFASSLKQNQTTAKGNTIKTQRYARRGNVRNIPNRAMDSVTVCYTPLRCTLQHSSYYNTAVYIVPGTFFLHLGGQALTVVGVHRHRHGVGSWPHGEDRLYQPQTTGCATR